MFGLVYKITNTINGKIYVGKTTKELCWYFDQTLRRALWGINDKPAICSAIRKHGKDAFIIHQIASAETEEELNKLEIYFISNLKATDYKIGYNIAPGGDGVSTHTAEARLKMSLRLKGVPKTQEHRKNLSIAKLGFKHTEETKTKMSLFRTGKSHNKEWVEKVALAHRGTKWSQELKAKHCVAQQNRWNKVKYLKAISNAFITIALENLIVLEVEWKLMNRLIIKF
jgi:group I intron endonuclease